METPTPLNNEMPDKQNCCQVKCRRVWGFSAPKSHLKTNRALLSKGAATHSSDASWSVNRSSFRWLCSSHSNSPLSFFRSAFDRSWTQGVRSGVSWCVRVILSPVKLLGFEVRLLIYLSICGRSRCQVPLKELRLGCSGSQSEISFGMSCSKGRDIDMSFDLGMFGHVLVRYTLSCCRYKSSSSTMDDSSREAKTCLKGPSKQEILGE